MVDEIKRGVLMIAGVNEALKFRKHHVGCSEEQVMKHIMSFLENSEFRKYKVDVMASVAHALKMTEREPRISDKQVIDRIMKEIPKIAVQEA
jgi:hypothetical protein